MNSLKKNGERGGIKEIDQQRQPFKRKEIMGIV